MWSRARAAGVLGGVLGALVVAGNASAAIQASFSCSPRCSVSTGTTVKFTSTSTSSSPLRNYQWDLDGDGLYGPADTPDEPYGPGASSAQRGFFSPATYTVGLLVSNRDGETSATTRSVTATGPVVNQPPSAAIDLDCEDAGSFGCPGQVVHEGKPRTFDASPSTDPDGTIVKYEWDFDANGTYEVNTGTFPKATHTYPDAGAATVRLRVTDNAGAQDVLGAGLIVKAGCRSEIVFKRLRATSPCFKLIKKKGGGFTSASYRSSDPIKVNGITIVPKSGKRVEIVGLLATNGSGLVSASVKSTGARAYTRVNGQKVKLQDGKINWAIGGGGKQLKGLKLSKFNGLKVTKLTGPVELSKDKKSSRIEFFIAMPGGMGGATSDKPAVLTPGKGANAAAGKFSFEVANGAIGPIGLEKLTVSYDGDGLWEIAGKVALPEPIPYNVSAGLGIQDGKFQYGEAEVDNLNVGPLGPGIFLQRIKFRIEVKPNPKKPQTSKCVPKIGIEKFNMDTRVWHKVGYHVHPAQILEIDHGVPDFALCGEVGLSAGPQILGAAAIRLDAGLGFATYPDRPTVLRAFGKVFLVEIPLAQATFEVHGNGYTKMRAEFNAGIDDIAHIEGFMKFEMLAPKFNAEAFIEACIDVVDLCAGARGLISSKGVAICLRLPFDWEPGIGYKWGGSLKLYWSGCSVGPYKEQINASASGKRRARAAGAVHTFTVPKGLPGTAVTVAGRGAPPKVTLLGPKGERYTTPAGNKAVKAPGYWLIKDVRNNTTSIAIFKPTPGRWRMVVDDDSVPVTSIQKADGLKKPRIKVRLTGRGHRRVLRYRVAPRKGQVVTFVEEGPSAGRRIGVAKKSLGRIRFRPADGRTERRAIYAVVEQDGFVRDRIRVARFRAPRAFRPSKPKGLRLRRRGSALLVRWRAPVGARRYEIKVALSNGRRLVFLTRRRSLRVRRVGRTLRAAVSVRGLSSTGVEGRTARAKVTSARKP